MEVDRITGSTVGSDLPGENKPAGRRGFSYKVTDERIRRWKALPGEVKLQW